MTLTSSIMYLIDYSTKHDFILPHKDRQINIQMEHPGIQQNQLLLLLRKLTN